MDSKDVKNTPQPGELEALNERLKEMGLYELALVPPTACVPQRKNARYMKPEVMRRLVENMKRSGTMESVPLVARIDGNTSEYQIISGHHRVEAAKKAGLELILVMVAPIASRDDLVSRQLAHNALEGQDDPVMLGELFQSIKDLELRMATGLQDELDKMGFLSLNFRAGEFKQFTILFFKDETEMLDEELERLASEMPVLESEAIRLGSLQYYDRFAKAIRKVKATENIKNNSLALLRLVELAEEALKARDGRQSEPVEVG